MTTPIISKQDMTALLGRSLKDVEDSNFELYLKIAIARLEDLLCTSIVAPLSVDLQLLLARCFGTIASEQTVADGHGVSSKKVEDFSINYDLEADSPFVQFVKTNQATIAKYSECQGKVISGKRSHDGIRCI